MPTPSYYITPKGESHLERLRDKPTLSLEELRDSIVLQEIDSEQLVLVRAAHTVGRGSQVFAEIRRSLKRLFEAGYIEKFGDE
jgi:DNA-binding PadR family transcriptional regulator